MVGTTILHYRILEKLGEGGMGVVYKAFDTKLQRQVALKFLPMFVTPNMEGSSRFLQEVHALSSLNHPNIATLYDMEEVEHHRFIALEYIEGETLRAKIQHGQLSIGEAIDYAIEIAVGLKYAHEHDVIHRDIKSENIMLTTDGRVKITDFGLAKLKGSDKLTRSSNTLGTAAYMSPEQARGEEVDLRTDIWSFGVMLYEMVTGQLPFPGDFEAAILYSVINEKHHSAHEIRPELPGELDFLIQKALQKDRDQRFHNVEEMLVELKLVRERSAPANVRTHRHGNLTDLWKEYRKSALLFIFLATLSLVLLLVFLKYLPDWRNSQTGTNLLTSNDGLYEYFLSDIISTPDDKSTVSQYLINMLGRVESRDFDLQSIGDSTLKRLSSELLSRMISNLYSEYQIAYYADLEKRFAEMGKITPQLQESWDFLRSIDCKAGTFSHLYYNKRGAIGKEYVLVVANFIEGNWEMQIEDSVVLGDVISMIDKSIRGAISHGKKSSPQGNILANDGEKLIIHRGRNSRLRPGMILEVNRLYRPFRSQDDSGVTIRLRELEEAIDYYRKHSGWESSLDSLTSVSEFSPKAGSIVFLPEKWTINEYRKLKSGKFLRSDVSATYLGIDVKVAEVFDTTAAAVIVARRFPWVSVKPGDELYLK